MNIFRILIGILALSFVLLIPKFLVISNRKIEALDILYELSIAYISAFIFYFLVVYLKEKQDKKNVYGYISQQVSKVIWQAKGLANSLARGADIHLGDSAFPNQEELAKICNSINPNAMAPLVLGKIGNNATWLQFCEYYINRSNKASEKIMSKLQYIDSELVSKLVKIEECLYFDNILFCNNIWIKNPDMWVFQWDLQEYFSLVKELEKYFELHLKKHS